MKKVFLLFMSVCMLSMSSCSIIQVASDNSVSRNKHLVDNQPTSTKYSVGDYYSQNGVKGVVVEVDASGQHGLIMSLTSSKDKWAADKSLSFETNSFSEDDGQKNMEYIAKYIKDNGKSWSDFPVFAWAKTLGDGWYIPSKDEAMRIWINMNNGSNRYKYTRPIIRRQVLLIHKFEWKPFRQIQSFGISPSAEGFG